jgi:hypothetical protein
MRSDFSDNCNNKNRFNIMDFAPVVEQEPIKTKKSRSRQKNFRLKSGELNSEITTVLDDNSDLVSIINRPESEPSHNSKVAQSYEMKLEM